MRLENSFQVPASPDEAWELLNDVPRVVPCMPGAELTEIVGENAWKAVMHVKLGPVALEFLTDVTREDLDETERRVVLSANGREARGRGRAQAKIESRLSDAAGKTDVTIVVDLSLQGTVAQYGRGIVADVSGQLTQQFAKCLAAQLQNANDKPAAPSEGAESTRGAASTHAQAPHEVKPIGGVKLGMRALWHAFIGLLRRLIGRFRAPGGRGIS